MCAKKSSARESCVRSRSKAPDLQPCGGTHVKSTGQNWNSPCPAVYEDEAGLARGIRLRRTGGTHRSPGFSKNSRRRRNSPVRRKNWLPPRSAPFPSATRILKELVLFSSALPNSKRARLYAKLRPTPMACASFIEFSKMSKPNSLVFSRRRSQKRKNRSRCWQD